jgi:uncharacterized protein (TIGR00369 family)
MNVADLYRKFSRWPLGRRAFSWLFCLRAPYFRSIRPRIEELRAGRCVARMRNRRAVRNHLGTVHAIAMCNLAEAVAGLCTEATIAPGLRWIPKGMRVDYLRKATTPELTAACALEPAALREGDCAVDVEITDSQGRKVCAASISMHVSLRPAGS